MKTVGAKRVTLQKFPWWITTKLKQEQEQQTGKRGIKFGHKHADTLDNKIINVHFLVINEICTLYPQGKRETKSNVENNSQGS